MKKFLVLSIVLFMLMVSVPLAADAQTCRATRRSYASKRSNQRYNARNSNRYRSGYNRRQYVSNEYIKDGPSFYRQRRNLINLGIATGGGALIGALAGGKRGALIGTAVGAGSGALYTYVLNKKKRRYYNR